MRKKLTSEELVVQSYAIRGYKTLGSRIPITKNLIDIYKLISSLGNDIYYGEFCSKIEEVISHVRSVFDKHYRLHKVPHINAKRVLELAEEAESLVESHDLEEKFEYLDKIEEEKEMVAPFDLPLRLGNYDSVFNGSLSIEIMGIPHTDFLRDLFIAFPEIFIDSTIGDLSPLVYAHELTHTQIESTKNACHDYQNCELISIFNEKLFALELDPTGNLLKEIEKRRFKSIKKNIEKLLNSSEYSPFELFKSSFYINSALKATHLFDKYLHSDEEGKRRIINGIQRVFDGEISVENLLEENNITYENSCNVELVKRHI